MLKKSALNRIMVSSLALIIATILYFFPKNTSLNTLDTNYIDINKTPIYVVNKDNYVVRTTTVINNKEPLKKAQELISALTKGSPNDYIPSTFKVLIPKNTKILDLSLENNLLKINFSKEFLNMNKDEEEQVIETLIYTLTEIKEIKQIMIFVENTKLNELPQSKINLPNALDRNFGINKIYDITSLKDLTKTTIYYIGKENNLTYYVPVTKIDNNKNNKIEIIIEELKSSPIYETNLISYLASNVKLLNYEQLENEIALSFNNAIFDDLKEQNILEEVKYSIGLSIKDNYPVNDVIFKVDNDIISVFN